MLENLQNLLGMNQTKPQPQQVDRSPMKERLIQIAEEYSNKIPIPMWFQPLLSKLFQSMDSPELDDETIMKFLNQARNMLEYIELGGELHGEIEPDKE